MIIFTPSDRSEVPCGALFDLEGLIHSNSQLVPLEGRIVGINIFILAKSEAFAAGRQRVLGKVC